MKQNRMRTMVIALALVLAFCTGALAASARPIISCYQELQRKLFFNGVEQVMYNEGGAKVEMISYENTTYLPIRAISNMLGIKVGWDQANNTIRLGTPNVKADFIQTVKPYQNAHNTHMATSTKSFAGKEYKGYLSVRPGVKTYYNLGGQYGVMTFKVYGDYDTNTTRTVTFMGDDNKVVGEVRIVGGYQLPTTHTVDLTGVQRLVIQCNDSGSSYNGTAYLFDMQVE